MPLNPAGKPAGNTDKIMLQYAWANHCQQTFKQNVIVANIGKPTFPVNIEAVRAGLSYWSASLTKAEKAREFLNDITPDDSYELLTAHNNIAQSQAAIGYGDPQGDLAAREKMVKALNGWYGNHFIARNILFVVGGAAGVHVIFEVINTYIPGGKILTPFPHYSLYKGSDGQNNLHKIDVMSSPGYKLTASLFKRTLKEALDKSEQDGIPISAFLLCDPNNPLGTTIGKNELSKIADELRKHPKIIIVLDEAYAEMLSSGEKYESLLSIAPDLKDRIILIRSATKALSSAGERMAVVVACNEDIMRDLVAKNTNLYGHAPRGNQYIFAEAMRKLDANELKTLNLFYSKQVEYTVARLQKIGASMPDPGYRVTGTFYVMADFTDLLGLQMPEESKKVFGPNVSTTKTDEDIAYYLLFQDGISISPLSYFGMPSKERGFMRITCSGGISELTELMDRLETRLKQARTEHLIKKINTLDLALEKIKSLSEETHHEILTKKSTLFNKFNWPNEMSCYELKKLNAEIGELASLAKINLMRLAPNNSGTEKAAIKIQSLWRGYKGRELYKNKLIATDNKWLYFLENSLKPLLGEALVKSMENFRATKRNQIPLWISFIQRNSPSQD